MPLHYENFKSSAKHTHTHIHTHTHHTHLFYTSVFQAVSKEVFKSVKPVNPKGNQPWIFTGRNVAEVDTPILWPPDAKSWLTVKDPSTGKGWRKRRRGWQSMRWWDSTWIDMNLSKLQETVEDRGSWHAAVHAVTKNQTQLSNCTTADSITCGHLTSKKIKIHRWQLPIKIFSTRHDWETFTFHFLLTKQVFLLIVVLKKAHNEIWQLK